MTEKEIRRLTRAELLEMLIRQSQELQRMQKELKAAEEALHSRRIALDEAGSIAEASLRLNGVFEAAQNACEQYTENIQNLSRRQEAVCAQREQESRERAEEMLKKAQAQADQTVQEAEARCAEMLRKAEQDSNAYWERVSRKMESFYREHEELVDLLKATERKAKA